MSDAEPDGIDDPRFTALSNRLGDYAASLLERSLVLARKLHATQLSSEHVLASILADEDCGATRLVLYAFADPDTLRVEVMAQCDGIMVVRSNGSLPFSVRALAALEEAHRGAAARGSETVEPFDVLCSAWRSLPEDVRARLKSLEESVGLAPPASRADARDPGSHLFATFDKTARQALGRAARAASENRRTSISPAHLILGALEADDSLSERTRLTRQAARFALTGVDDDPTPLGSAPLEVSQELLRLFEPLPPGAGTSAILGRFLAAGSDEVRALLVRQKVTPQLFERAGDSFSDPDCPPAGD